MGLPTTLRVRLILLSLLLALITSIELVNGQTPEERARAEALFRGHCAACHGIDGAGNGPRATGMTPPPTNFRDAAHMATVPDNDLEQAILAGKPGTAMTGYGTILTPQDVAVLVKYLRSLSASP